MPEVIRPMRQKLDTAANWATNNPVLGNGEIAIDTTNRLRKTGNGVKTWSQLAGEPIGDRTWSVLDTFGRTSGQPIGSNYQQYIRYATTEILTNGSSADVYRVGAPTAGDWADGAVYVSDSKNLGQHVEVNITALNTNDTSAASFSGYPGVSAILRAPGAKLASETPWTTNATTAAGMAQAVFAMIKPGGWFVFVTSPGTSTTPNGTDSVQNGWCAFRGSGSFTGSGQLVAEITADDLVSLSYKGSTILPPTLLNGAPKNTYTGFGVGAGSSGTGGGNRVVRFAASNL